MTLMPVEEALKRILLDVKPVRTEVVPLARAHGRVLVKAIVAKRDQPPFAASAMDGYAVRQADLQSLPVELSIAGTSAAGHGYFKAFKAGEAIRILTGAPLPPGADTVVIQENTERQGSRLRILQATPPGKNVRLRGLDFRSGDELIPAATKLNARDIGLAAAGNTARVTVRRLPHVVLFTTGDELVLPGKKPRADQIVSSNSHALEAMFTAWGARVTNLGIIGDRLKAIESGVKKGLGADILVTTGGASVGDTDFVQEAFKNCGVRIDFWKIALRPGKPLMYGRKGKTKVIGLPGNPVSALVCSEIFVRPLLAKLRGEPPRRAEVTAALGSDLAENDNRQDYIRAVLSFGPDGERIATPFATQDSSMQRTLRNSDCLIVREPHASAGHKGDRVAILILDF